MCVSVCHAKHIIDACSVVLQSELFQDDLYPDAIGDIPALGAEEWIEGRNAPPLLVRRSVF